MTPIMKTPRKPTWSSTPDAVDMINQRIDYSTTTEGLQQEQKNREARIKALDEQSKQLDASQIVADIVDQDPAATQFIKILKAQQELDSQKKQLASSTNKSSPTVTGGMIINDLASDILAKHISSLTITMS